MTPLKTPLNDVVIVGCGDIGIRVAPYWQQQGLEVTGIVKTQSSADKLEQAGIKACLLDLDSTDSKLFRESLAIGPSTLVYYFAPPPSQGSNDPRMSFFLSVLGQNPDRLIYISTSGVYGDQQGNIVTENTPTNPQVDRARRRFDAEQQVRKWSQQSGGNHVILRVGGIYGPGRLPIKRISQGIPMVHEDLAPQTNRIHADDLAQVCVAAALRAPDNRVYNVSDGCDSNMTEYFNTIADFLGLPRPPLVDWEEAEQTISKGMMSYLRESRRMDNTRMLTELDITLSYPDLKAGLESCLADKVG